MEITIDYAIFSVEFGKTTKSSDISELNEKMKLFFQDKSYLNVVEKYYIGLICVSPGFDQFFKPKRPKYYDDKLAKVKGLPGSGEIHMKHQFCCEIKLDYSTFVSSNKENGYNIIANSVLKFLEDLKYPTAIKKFDKKSFNNDMREFFIQIGCAISNE